MHAVLVDDDPVMLRAMSATVQRWGFTIEPAASGHAAWQLLENQERPVILILDWVLPDIEGPELCRRVRALPHSQLIYAILLTSKTRKADVIEGLQAGADDYMAKPFDPDELFARMQVGTRLLGAQMALTARIRELAEAQACVQQLQGLLPICCYCKNIRTDENYWEKVEHYFGQHTALQFSHGICPHCYKNIVVPELEKEKIGETQLATQVNQAPERRDRPAPPLQKH
jgi:phosphoserine phosphatase RsbU/P